MQRRQFGREIELEAVKLVRDRGATRAQASPDLRSAFPRKSRSLFDLGSTTPREELDVRVGNTHDATRFLAARMPLQGPQGAVAVSRSESRTWLVRAPSPRTRSNETLGVNRCASAIAGPCKARRAQHDNDGDTAKITQERAIATHA